MKKYLEDFLALLALIFLTAICGIGCIVVIMLIPFLLPYAIIMYLTLYNKMKISGGILTIVWSTILISGGILCWEYLF